MDLSPSLLATSIPSATSAAYCSVSFMYALHESIQRNNQRMVIAFIACSG